MLGSRTAKGQHVVNIIYALGLVQFSHARVLVALGASVPARLLVLTAHVVLRAEAPVRLTLVGREAPETCESLTL